MVDDSAEDRQRRAEMVERQLRARGIADEHVLAAMGGVPRHAFVPATRRLAAYSDAPLPIGRGQTISQPYIVAMMAEAARIGSGDRVLEIGTGSGYGAAVLDELAARVTSVERIGDLVQTARDALVRTGHDRVVVIHDDGTGSSPEHAWAAGPYDAIIVTACAPEIPHALKAALAPGGRLVVPVGPLDGVQRLMRVVRTGEDTFEEEDLGGVRFVPLIGEEGWPEGSRPLD